MPNLRVPPGRAGRLWLRHRLDAAAHGADVLERSLRALRAHEREYRQRCRRAERELRAAVGAAEEWLRRAATLGGQRSIALAGRDGAARVDVTWAVTMGVRHPAGASCRLPERQADEVPPAGTALVHAEAAYRAALAAAADLAAARAAVRLLQREADATGRRARALRRHWIPALTEALARCELALAEREHEEWVRRRWAADTGG